MNLSTAEDYFLTSADVVALYPSISIEDGLAALQWFMKVHTNIPENLQILYLHLARFVLENNYVECKGLDDCTIFFTEDWHRHGNLILSDLRQYFHALARIAGCS